MGFGRFRRPASGFTVVETMIVLAIAGTISAVVFLAIPQLQRSSRDNTRKAIATRLRGEIENYASNHEGQYPFGSPDSCSSTPTAPQWADFYTNYINGESKYNDPSTGQPVISCPTGTNFSDSQAFIAAFPGDNSSVTLPNTKGVVGIVTGASCKGSDVAKSNANNVYALVIGLENGAHFCIDNT